MGKFFYMIREQAREQGLFSDEHFTVDTTLINALASQAFPGRRTKDQRRQGPPSRKRLRHNSRSCAASLLTTKFP